MARAYAHVVLGTLAACTAETSSLSRPSDAGFAADAGAADAAVVEVPPDGLRCAPDGVCELGARGERTCEAGAVCATGDGLGWCACTIDGVSCGVCFRRTDLGVEVPLECASTAECAGAPCIYDHGCVRPRAFCSALACSAAAAGEYCGCDGRTFTAGCPQQPYAHVGPCP